MAATSGQTCHEYQDYSGAMTKLGHNDENHGTKRSVLSDANTMREMNGHGQPRENWNSFQQEHLEQHPLRLLDNLLAVVLRQCPLRLPRRKKMRTTQSCTQTRMGVCEEKDHALEDISKSLQQNSSLNKSTRSVSGEKDDVLDCNAKSNRFVTEESNQDATSRRNFFLKRPSSHKDEQEQEEDIDMGHYIDWACETILQTANVLLQQESTIPPGTIRYVSKNHPISHSNSAAPSCASTCSLESALALLDAFPIQAPPKAPQMNKDDTEANENGTEDSIALSTRSMHKVAVRRLTSFSSGRIAYLVCGDQYHAAKHTSQPKNQNANSISPPTAFFSEYHLCLMGEYASPPLKLTKEKRKQHANQVASISVDATQEQPQEPQDQHQSLLCQRKYQNMYCNCRYFFESMQHQAHAHHHHQQQHQQADELPVVKHVVCKHLVAAWLARAFHLILHTNSRSGDESQSEVRQGSQDLAVEGLFYAEQVVSEEEFSCFMMQSLLS